MKNSKNSTTTAVSAKQNSLKSVAVPFRNKNVGQNVAIYNVNVNDRQHEVLAYLNLTLDAYLVAIPQTGLKAQGKDRVLVVPKNDSLKAEFRAHNLAIAKLTEAINASCRGKSWSDFCHEVAGITKAELLRDTDGKLVKDENGKYVKTGNIVAKYSTFTKSEGLKARDERILNAVEKYLKALYKREAKLKALRAEAKPQKQSEAS